MSRTLGSRNFLPPAPPRQMKGAASSACKFNGRFGVAQVAGVAWYEHGRAVKWKDVMESVARGYERARWRAAQRGIKWLDGFERVQASIAESINARSGGKHA